MTKTSLKISKWALLIIHDDEVLQYSNLCSIAANKIKCMYMPFLGNSLYTISRIILFKVAMYINYTHSKAMSIHQIFHRCHERKMKCFDHRTHRLALVSTGWLNVEVLLKDRGWSSIFKARLNQINSWMFPVVITGIK